MSSSSKHRTSASCGRDEQMSLKSSQLNLTAVLKVDAEAIEIKKSSPIVVLYKYDPSDNKWERSATEGPLFVYKRSSHPIYGFAILNRLKSENVKVFIYPNMDLRVQSSFVLYKDEADEIFGLSFPEESIAQDMGKYLMQTAEAFVSDQATVNEEKRFRSSSAPFSVQANSGSFIPERDIQMNGAKSSVVFTDSCLADPGQCGTMPRTSEIIGGKIERNKTGGPQLPKSKTSSVGLIAPESFGAKSSQKSFGAKTTENVVAATSDALQSLFISVSTEPNSSLSHAPIGAYSLAEVEKKLQVDVLGQQLPPFNPQFISPVPPTESIQPNVTPSTGLLLVQPSVYASTSSPNISNASSSSTSTKLPCQPEGGQLSPECAILNNTRLQQDLFPSIPPLMHSAGMKASPLAPTTSEASCTLKTHPTPLPANNVGTEAPPFLISKQELQTALQYLIEHDDAFLTRIYEAYVETRSKK